MLTLAAKSVVLWITVWVCCCTKVHLECISGFKNRVLKVAFVSQTLLCCLELGHLRVPLIQLAF